MAATLIAMGAGALAPSAATAQVLLDRGHVDAVAPTFVGGQITIKVKDGTVPGAPVVREPSDVLFRVKPEGRTTVRSGLPPAYAFLGPPGSTIWLLPQVQSDNPAVVWAGWSSESIPAGQFEGDRLEWRLLSVDGPGPVQLYETDAFGSPRMIFDSANGLPDLEHKAAGTHSHFNWVFHTAGVHRVRFEVSGTPAGQATAITSGPVDYRFEIVDPSSGGGGEGGGGSGGGSDPGGVPGGDHSPDPPPSPAVPLKVTLKSAKMHGRRLTLQLRVTRRSHVSVAVTRDGRVQVRSKRLTVGAGQRRLHLRLKRKPAPGRYRVRVSVRSGDQQVVRSVRLRLRGP